METLTVADLAALLAAMQSVPRMRGQAATKEKLLSALREAMEAQPAHADQQKVSMMFSARGSTLEKDPSEGQAVSRKACVLRMARLPLARHPAREHASTCRPA